MDRRRALFFLVLGLTSIRSGAAAGTPRIAVLSLAPAASFKGRADALRRGMQALGYREGRHVRYAWRHANGRTDDLPGLAQALVRQGAEVIVSDSSASSLALRNATNTIPVVMAAAENPVASRLARSLAHSDTNFTGLALAGPDHSLKLAQALFELVPKAARVALVANPGNALYRHYRSRVHAAALEKRAEVEYLDALQPADLPRAFAAAARASADGIVVMHDAMYYNERRRVAEAASRAKRPTVYPTRGYVEAGGLLSLGPDLENNFERAASYVDRILKGAKPAGLPIEEPSQYELVVNRNAARALALSIPRGLLDRADRVIG